MSPDRTRAALAPMLSSPGWLCAAGFFVTLGVCLIQAASGISPWRASAPIELSSSIVAAMAAVWSFIQLRTYWNDPAPRRSWLLLSAAMVILSLEDRVGDWLTLATQSLYEMIISATLWIIAAALIHYGCQRYAARRYVIGFVMIGFALQIIAQGFGLTAAMIGFSLQVAAQGFGLTAAMGVGTSAQIDSLKILNDAFELLAVLAYLFAMFFAEFGSVRSIGFAAILAPAPGPARRADARSGGGDVIPFDRSRRSSRERQ